VARQPSPHAEQLATAVRDLVAATLRNDASAAQDVLTGIGYRITEVERRTGVSLATTIAVFRRDSWTCRYCGARTIPIPVLRVLSALYPDEFPHHPNWKAGQYHPAYLLVTTSLDHVHPGGRAGSWTDSENLVAACWPCNTGKADLTLRELGWDLLDAETVHSQWDGLTDSYPSLWQLAGAPEERYHRTWLRALETQRNS
jgi:5-methylcytosine-specific restriction endonuclease McrA